MGEGSVHSRRPAGASAWLSLGGSQCPTCLCDRHMLCPAVWQHSDSACSKSGKTRRAASNGDSLSFSDSSKMCYDFSMQLFVSSASNL